MPARRKRSIATRGPPFWYRPPVSIDLGRRLIASGAVAPEEVEAALFLSVVRGVPFARVLIDRGAITERGLEEELERVGGLGLRQVAGASDLVARLPKAMCRRLAAVPTRVDPGTGSIDVAAADPLDPHLAAEFGFHLGAQIRVLRAPIAAIEEEIRRLELDEQGSQVLDRIRQRRVTPPFPHGAPQSTIPPPEEAPIPLVRRLPSQPLPHELAAPQSSPLPPPRVLEPRSDDDVLPPQGSRLVPSAPRQPTLREPPPAFPSVSFPSDPPPAASFTTAPQATSNPGAHAPIIVPHPGGSSRTTPTYGTPALVPPSAQQPDFAAAEPARHRSRRTIRPAFAEPAAADGVADALPPEARLAPPLTPTTAPFPPPSPVPAPPPPARAVGKETLIAGTLPRAEPPPEPPRAEIASPPDEPPPAAPARLRGDGGSGLDGSAVLTALRGARDRDEVVRLALRGMRLAARRLAVFVVKRDGFHGWACNVDLGDPDALRDLAIPHDQPSVLATAAATGTYLGPIPGTAAHEGLLRVMETSSRDVAAVAVRVGGRPAMVLLADDLEDTMLGTRWLGELAAAVGEALARLLGR